MIRDKAVLEGYLVKGRVTFAGRDPNIGAWWSVCVSFPASLKLREDRPADKCERHTPPDSGVAGYSISNFSPLSTIFQKHLSFSFFILFFGLTKCMAGRFFFLGGAAQLFCNFGSWVA